MKERKILEYLLRVKGVDKEKLRSILENKPKDEDMVSFLIRMNLISYEDLNTIAEFTTSQKPLDKRDLEKQGIFFEDVYFHYHRDDGSVYIVPYYHMRVIEKRKNVVNLYTGGIDKISVKLDDENTADAFLDMLLLYINRTFLHKTST